MNVFDKNDLIKQAKDTIKKNKKKMIFDMNNKNGSSRKLNIIIIMVLFGLLSVMVPGVALKVAANRVDDDGERPSAEIIQEIKHLLLNKIGVVSPPPPTDGASLMSEQEAKAYSIRNWRRDTRPHPEQMETVSSTVSAQIAHEGNLLFQILISHKTITLYLISSNQHFQF